MIIYPAIDLRGGRCVRLQQGDFARETVYADDPVEAAGRWAAEGAAWLHVVNLDGALGRSGEANLAALARIRRAVDLPIQFGGGLRSVEDVDRVLDLGVARIILGTVAIREPEVVREALARYGAERIAVGIDARDGRVAISGWVDVSEVEAVDLGRRMAALGVQRVVYTDVARDGMLTGPNVPATAALARETGLRVIASGGVSSLDDLEQLAAHAADGIDGVIVGMALYEGRLTLPEALALLGEASGD
ncbi:MAG: 1-(5-phosphoribosyl)-5-[(5-phosphoribosylamino)methylideneamino]imidazole-4-carboxamide isomerase [Chloroflexi bacterium]|nr:1-(5-phosphoribosyl)-5-[(5-phosphoribosylamino)methylideneamino]imidazole-4-carboxamide isomerase [Chloroflexota bacterium]